MIWLLACATHTVLSGQVLESVPAYPSVVQSWTREESRHDGLETVLLIRATWDSPAFVAAREQQRGYLLALPPEVVDEQTSSEQAESQEFWHFTLIASTDVRSRPKLTANGAPWRVRMVVGETECTLKTLEERAPDTLDRALYPWLNPWNNVWNVVFKKDCGEGSPTLQVLGPRASAELRW